jgi:hypothetical protein
MIPHGIGSLRDSSFNELLAIEPTALGVEVMDLRSIAGDVTQIANAFHDGSTLGVAVVLY